MGKRKSEVSEPRTPEAIDADYTQVCAQLGHLLSYYKRVPAELESLHDKVAALIREKSAAVPYWNEKRAKTK